MLDKLKAVAFRFEELCARSEQPDFYNDPQKAAKMLKERNELEPIVEAYQAYRQAEQDMAEAEELNLFDRAFDMGYAWEIHHMMCDIAKGERRVWDLRNTLYADRTKYPASAMRMMFTSNHDENSWSGSEFTRFGASLEVMTALTFLWEAAMPLIYTGQEVGYDHSFKFFDKDHIPHYEANANTELYRKLINLKHSQKALQAGEQGGRIIEIENNAKDCLMTFVREKDDSRVVAILNLSPYTIHANFNNGIYAGNYTNAITGEEVLLPVHLEYDIEPWGYTILYK